MNLHAFMGLTANILLFVPVSLITFFGLYKNISLFILCIYYLVTGIYNLMMQGYISIAPSFTKSFGTVLNYLDTPMMLMVLLFFCASTWKKKVIYFSIAFFIVYELIILVVFKLSTKSNIYILAPGIITILVYSIYLFIQFGKTTIINGKGLGHTLILVSIAFSYGCFFIIYFLHYIQKTSVLADVLLIYYLVLINSSLALTVGLVWINKRVKEIREVQVSRKELAHFFNV
ncbi:MAG TPA: hypothetical protein VM888_01615 [Chitinophagaceae bacterium]|nr:hypothetical protein [Chitinophagaceae bacterium]